MIDPREEKLPKWAQDLLYAERLKNALRFPEAPRPVPDFVYDANGHTLGVKLKDFGGCVYSENGSHILRHFVDKNGFLHRHEDLTGFGARPQGNYYIDLADARLAYRWRLAEKAARDLLEAQAKEPSQ